MLGIKNKDDLEKYCNEIGNSSVKESVDKLKRLNKEDVFIYDITPEEEEKYIKNTVRNIARREGLEEGQKAEKEAIALKLLKANYPIDGVVNVTGLTREEIEKVDKN